MNDYSLVCAVIMQNVYEYVEISINELEKMCLPLIFSISYHNVHYSVKKRLKRGLFGHLRSVKCLK